jgi:uncharacterized repeat protein (TIGR03803 family)
MRNLLLPILIVCVSLSGCSHAHSALPQPAGITQLNRSQGESSPTNLPRQYSVVYSFQGGTDGAGPRGVLIQDASGTLYGTTALGGDSACRGGCGTVFKLDPSGTETVLHRFNGSVTSTAPQPSAVTEAAAWPSNWIRAATRLSCTRSLA